MNSNNFGIITGRVTRDVELRGEEGKHAAFINLAVSRNYKNKETGDYDTDFISLVAFRTRAEFAAKYLKKGTAVTIEYTVQSNTVEVEKDGKKVNLSTNQLVVNSIQFALTNKSKDGAAADTANNGAQAAPEFEELEVDDDLPF